MGLFSFFRKDKQSNPTAIQSDAPNLHAQPEIPKELFIEDGDPNTNQPENWINQSSKGIEAIYAFLQTDYESKGYSDALMNPDDSYRNDNIKLINLDLQILIQKVTTYYEDLVREIDFHSSSRGRAGLIDLVEELGTRKEMVIQHMEKVEEVKVQLQNNTGLTQRLILSYQRGFMKGLSAITQSNVLNRNF
jgi:hypothetical protein